MRTQLNLFIFMRVFSFRIYFRAIRFVILNNYYIMLEDQGRIWVKVCLHGQKLWRPFLLLDLYGVFWLLTDASCCNMYRLWCCRQHQPSNKFFMPYQFHSLFMELFARCLITYDYKVMLMSNVVEIVHYHTGVSCP